MNETRTDPDRKNREVPISEIRQAIETSGYPFELRVASEFKRLGFDVKPHYRFFDKGRGKEREIDLLSTFSEMRNTNGGRNVNTILNIGVECKDNSLPYVCFGFDGESPPPPDALDPDFGYLHLNTSRDDGMRNRFALVGALSDFNKIKGFHHHFVAQPRFYSVAAIEESGKRLKLHIPDRFRNALDSLGAFLQDSHEKWNLSGRSGGEIEDMSLHKGPTIIVLFSMLAHSGDHFRYSITDEGIVASGHTPVFLTNNSPSGTTSFVVDLVNQEGLERAVEEIIKSFRALAEHLCPWVLAQKRN